MGEYYNKKHKVFNYAEKGGDPPSAVPVPIPAEPEQSSEVVTENLEDAMRDTVDASAPAEPEPQEAAFETAFRKHRKKEKE